jgi:hypothetical protein
MERFGVGDNGSMRPAPFLISAGLVLAASTSAIHVAAARDPFAAGPVVVISFGLLVFTLTAVVGLLLSRGRWARSLAACVAGGALALSATGDLDVWAIIALAAAAAALFGITGPWLRQWLRQRTAATGPGLRPTLVLIGSLALIPGVGLASPSGLDWQHWLLAASSLALAWAYSRASSAALWGLRLLLAGPIVLAASASPPVGATYLIVHGSVVVALAWSGESLRAAQPLIDRAYGPRSARKLDPRAGDAP